jgi:hypothetical protein
MRRHWSVKERRLRERLERRLKSVPRPLSARKREWREKKRKD